MTPARASLYKLIDELPESEVATVEKFIMFLLHECSEPIQLEPLNDPSEGELRPEFLQSLQQAEEESKNGQTVPWNQVKREMGL